MKISFWLVAVGAILSSIAAAGINSLKDTTLVILFLVGLGIAVLGGFIRKLEVKSQLKEVEEQGEHAPVSTLEEILTRVEKIVNSDVLKEDSDPSPEKLQELMNEIESISMDVILPFMERKELLTEKWGLANYAQFAIEFAYGERYLNRSYSALIDQYLMEAKKSLEIAQKFFKKSLDMVRSWEERKLNESSGQSS